MPPESSLIRTIVGRENERPERLVITLRSPPRLSGPDREPLDAVEAVELQPLGAVPPVGFGSLGGEHPDAALESSRGEGDHGLAGGVQPLHVVERDDHRRVRRESVERGQECRGDDAFVGNRPGAVTLQQHAVERHSLKVGQSVEDLGGDALEKVGQHRVGQAGLGLPGPRRQDVEAALPGLLQGAQPERGLADTRFTFDDQRRRTGRSGFQKCRYPARFSRPAHPERNSPPPNASHVPRFLSPLLANDKPDVAYDFENFNPLR